MEANLGDSRTIATLFQGRARQVFSMDLVVDDANAESLREMLTPRGLKRMLKHTKKLATVRKKLV